MIYIHVAKGLIDIWCATVHAKKIAINVRTEFELKELLTMKHSRLFNCFGMSCIGDYFTRYVRFTRIERVLSENRERREKGGGAAEKLRKSENVEDISGPTMYLCPS